MLLDIDFYIMSDSNMGYIVSLILNEGGYFKGLTESFSDIGHDGSDFKDIVT